MKTIIYLFIVFVTLLITSSCSESINSIDSDFDNLDQLKSNSDLFQDNLLLSSWNGPFTFLGQGITTNHSPIYNNQFHDVDEVIFTRVISSPFQALQIGSDVSSPGCYSQYIFTDRPPSALTNADNQLLIAYKEFGGTSILMNTFSVNGPLDSPVCPTVQVPNAQTNTGPTIVSSGGRSFHLLYKSHSSNTIYEQFLSYILFPFESMNWTSPTPIAGTNTNTTPGGAFFNNRVYLFYKGPNSTTIYYRYKSGGNWSNEFSLSTSESRTPSTPTVRAHGNLLYLVYRGEDDRIYYRTMNTSGNWSPQNSTVSSVRTNSAPDIRFQNNTMIISYRDRSTGRPSYIWRNI